VYDEGMFGSIDIKVRPIRLAYLVDPGDASQTRDAIRLASTLWGGSYSPIIPLYKKMPISWRESPSRMLSASRVILGYIEAFDPDILVQCSATVPAYINDLGLKIVRPEEIWRPSEQRNSPAPAFGLGLFELLEDIFRSDFRYKTKYPIKIVLPQIPKELSLFGTSLFGEIPPNLMTPLGRNYFEALEIVTTVFQSDKLPELMKANVMFPRRITQRGIAPSHRSGVRGNANLFFMDATRVEDIIDFWNLSAAGRQVLPVPKQLAQNVHLQALVIEFLKASRRPWSHNARVCDYASIIRARSCTMPEVQDYAKSLVIEREAGDTSADPFFSLQHWYPRIWDEWARSKDAVVPTDIYGEEEVSLDLNDQRDVKFRFTPLLPKFAQKYSFHGEPRCANELSFRFYGSDEYLAEALPKSSGQNYARAISGFGYRRDEWRVGRNGLVGLIKDRFTETGNIPRAESVMFAWLADHGWEAKLSPPGVLAKQIYKRLDGHPLPFLIDEKILGLIEHMNGGLVQRDGGPTKNEIVGSERHLSVAQVKSRTRTPDGGFGLYNYLLSKGIFKLGLRARCPTCFRSSWFPIEELHAELTCPKCLEVVPAIGTLENAEWCYKTAGPFSVAGYADGAYAVLLSLEFFGRHNRFGSGATPVLSFTAQSSGKKALEADFALFWQESIFGEQHDGIAFGECKTYGTFEKKDFDRMRYLAKAFPGAVLIFSTLRKSLSKKEITEIRHITQAGRKYWKPERPINPVLILTGNELLKSPGPPYCWDDSTKKKFEHLFGLLSLCDATQQIYLGIPSWETQWHEQWERKRQRWLERKGASNKDIQS
jgi:hypothetical protein